jgi:hypothetical protein
MSFNVIGGDRIAVLAVLTAEELVTAERGCRVLSLS